MGLAAHRMPVMRIPDDPKNGRTEIRIVGFTAADPDPKLFEVPAGYDTICKTSPCFSTARPRPDKNDSSLARLLGALLRDLSPEIATLQDQMVSARPVRAETSTGAVFLPSGTAPSYRAPGNGKAKR